jgi:hypothetical protein
VKKRLGYRVVPLLMLFGAASVLAQTMERPKDWEVGDKASYKWVLNNKAQQLDEEWTAITDNELQFTLKAAGRTYEGQWTDPP